MFYLFSGEGGPRCKKLSRARNTQKTKLEKNKNQNTDKIRKRQDESELE